MLPVSSLYIHVPFCQHLCNYCDFYKRKLEDPAAQFQAYEQYLLESWARHQQLMSEQQASWEELETLYLGGGTPSLWGERGAAFLQQHILSQVSLSPGAEFTMEIDPGTWNPAMVESWQKIGLNRISIGTQSLDPRFLKLMDRVHSLEESLALLDYCSRHDWNFSLDFLLGLPHSEKGQRDVLRELEQLLKYKPRHISLYILNARSKYPLAQHLPDDEFTRREYLSVSDYLQRHGFHHYEVSNFAQLGFESLHNLKYWDSRPVAGLGPTGTGLLVEGPRKALRYKWKVTQAEFEREPLGETELDLERTYLSLRTSKGWRPTEVTKGLVQVFEQWTTAGYGQFNHGVMVLSPLGYLMLDSLMNDLFLIPDRLG
jgi:oxygen-independent coproporphyrinogen III oxidase